MERATQIFSVFVINFLVSKVWPGWSERQFMFCPSKRGEGRSRAVRPDCPALGGCCERLSQVIVFARMVYSSR